MAAPILKFRDSAGALLTGAVAISGTEMIPGTPVEIQITHESGDATRNPRLISEVRSPVATTFDPDHEWRAKGVAQARITGGLGGLSVAATGWVSLGSASFLPLPVTVAGQGVVIEYRLDAPSGLAIGSAQVAPKVVSDQSEEAGVAASMLVGDGIHLPLRDGSAYALCYASANVLENPGGADDQVQIPAVVWIGAGIPWGLASYLETIDDLDSAAAALVAGEAVKVRLTLGPAGLVVQTKGVKAVAASAVAPAWPLGARLATITRAFDGLVNTVDIEGAVALDLFGWSSSSLTGTVGAGQNAIVDGRVIYSTTASNATLTASDTNQVFLLRDGSLDVTDDDTKPAPRALLIHEAVTDGSGVTAHRDRRQFIGYSPGEVAFQWLGTIATAAYRYAHVPGNRDAYVLPIGGVTASIGVQAVTPASGATTFDVEYLDTDGTTWRSLFDATARPSIAYNATGLGLVDRDVRPIRLVLPAGTLLRANVTAIPAGAAADPKDGTLLLRFAL